MHKSMECSTGCARCVVSPATMSMPVHIIITFSVLTLELIFLHLWCLWVCAWGMCLWVCVCARALDACFFCSKRFAEIFCSVYSLGLFLSPVLTQALFYICCFKHQHLIMEDLVTGELVLFEELELQRIVECPLNPLKVCVCVCLFACLCCEKTCVYICVYVRVCTVYCVLCVLCSRSPNFTS